MDEPRDDELKCPRCGHQMTRGFISAGKGPMRWVTTTKENKTIFGGDHLTKFHWFWGRHDVPAARCVTCKVGVFSYE